MAAGLAAFAPLAGASDYRPATQRVFRSRARPSHIALTVRTR